MNVIEKLFGLLTRNDAVSEKEIVDAEMCPNCWGKQEYANEYREVIKERSKNPNEQKAFVEQFIETHLTGVRLKPQEDKLVCPSCTGVYKKSSSNAN